MAKSNSNMVITGYSVNPVTQQITSLEVNGEIFGGESPTPPEPSDNANIAIGTKSLAYNATAVITFPATLYGSLKIETGNAGVWTEIPDAYKYCIPCDTDKQYYDKLLFSEGEITSDLRITTDVGSFTFEKQVIYNAFVTAQRPYYYSVDVDE